MEIMFHVSTSLDASPTVCVWRRRKARKSSKTQSLWARMSLINKKQKCYSTFWRWNHLKKLIRSRLKAWFHFRPWNLGFRFCPNWPSFECILNIFLEPPYSRLFCDVKRRRIGRTRKQISNIGRNLHFTDYTPIIINIFKLIRNPREAVAAFEPALSLAAGIIHF